MSSDRALQLGQGALIAVASALALFWPRPGEPAMLVGLGPNPVARALTWAANENARLIAFEGRSPRVIVAAPGAAGLLRALGQGLVPIAAGAAGCEPTRQGRIEQWKN